MYNEQYDDHWDDHWDYTTCQHGIYKGLLGGYCKACDKEEEEHGGIEKCLNCGRYKWADQMNYGPICKIQCRNPNEY